MKHATALIAGLLALSLAGPSAAQPKVGSYTSKPSPQDTAFKKAVLESMGIQYTSRMLPNGFEEVEWPFSDMAQVQEINLRVMQYNFIRRECPGMALPEPSQPARASLSCSRPRK
jgi:hypothetical protein